LCWDELVDSALTGGGRDVLLLFNCQGCGNPVDFLALDGARTAPLQIKRGQRLRLVPGPLVNECRAEEMLRLESLGAITLDEFLDFCLALQVEERSRARSGAAHKEKNPCRKHSLGRP
jgi:hypothetical protein